MKTLTSHVLACSSLCVGALMPSTQGAVVFEEAFSGSTLGSASPTGPGPDRTDYQVASSKNATASSLGSSLSLAMGATSSGFAQVQALISPSAVTLGAGQAIRVEMSFVPTNIVLPGTGASLNVGLYNSGGSAPVAGNAMANAGMGGGTSFVNGGARGWSGYVARIQDTAGDLYTRDPQNDTTDENQDLLFSNAGTGAYDEPAGITLSGSGDAGFNFTNGETYTLSLQVAYDGSDVTVSQSVMHGGSTVYSRTGSQTGGYTSFDSLAFGFRGTNDSGGGSAPATLQVTSLRVTTVPEPSAVALFGLAAAGGLCRRRRR